MMAFFLLLYVHKLMYADTKIVSEDCHNGNGNLDSQLVHNINKIEIGIIPYKNGIDSRK